MRDGEQAAQNVMPQQEIEKKRKMQQQQRRDGQERTHWTVVIARTHAIFAFAQSSSTSISSDAVRSFYAAAMSEGQIETSGRRSVCRTLTRRVCICVCVYMCGG